MCYESRKQAANQVQYSACLVQEEKLPSITTHISHKPPKKMSGIQNYSIGGNGMNYFTLSLSICARQQGQRQQHPNQPFRLLCQVRSARPFACAAPYLHGSCQSPRWARRPTPGCKMISAINSDSVSRAGKSSGQSNGQLTGKGPGQRTWRRQSLYVQRTKEASSLTIGGVVHNSATPASHKTSSCSTYRLATKKRVSLTSQKQPEICARKARAGRKPLRRTSLRLVVVLRRR